jgi:hypothetical protein
MLFSSKTGCVSWREKLFIGTLFLCLDPFFQRDLLVRYNNDMNIDELLAYMTFHECIKLIRLCIYEDYDTDANGQHIKNSLDRPAKTKGKYVNCDTNTTASVNSSFMSHILNRYTGTSSMNDILSLIDIHSMIDMSEKLNGNVYKWYHCYYVCGIGRGTIKIDGLDRLIDE